MRVVLGGERVVGEEEEAAEQVWLETSAGGLRACLAATAQF